MTSTMDATTETAVKPVQIRCAGFGGQGIVLTGKILGQAAAIYEGVNAVMTQSYGPEARGGACSADVVISRAQINYPRVTTPEVLVLMAEEAARTYGPNTAPDATILVNQDLVKTLPDGPGLTIRKVPATGIAEELGRVIMANIVMLGFLTASTDVISHDAMKQAILASIPKGTEKMNMAAFDAGYRHGADAS